MDRGANFEVVGLIIEAVQYVQEDMSQFKAAEKAHGRKSVWAKAPFPISAVPA